MAIKAAAHIANAMGMGEATATMETMELARSVSESESAGLRDDVDDDLLGNGTTSETDKDKGFIHEYDVALRSVPHLNFKRFCRGFWKGPAA